MMKIEYTSLFLGLSMGVVGAFSVLNLLGDAEKEFSYRSKISEQNEDIYVRIEHSIENGEELTSVVLKGKGGVTKKDLEQELDKMLKEEGIDKEETNLRIDMEVQG